MKEPKTTSFKQPNSTDVQAYRPNIKDSTIKGPEKRLGILRFTRSFNDQRVIYKIFLLAPAILVLLSLGLYPSFYQIFISFTSYRLGYEGYHFVGFKNYINVLNDPRFAHSIQVWLEFAAIAILIEMFIGLVMSFSLNSIGSKNAKFVLPVLIIPLVLSPVVMGSLFRMMLSNEFGVIIWLVRSIGIKMSNPLASAVWVVPALSVVDAWQWTPFVALITYAGLQSIPQEVIEAAKVDGANWLQMILRISIPLIFTEIMISFLFLLFRCLKAFDTVFAMTNGGPGISSEVFNFYLYQKAFTFIETGQAAVMGFFVLIVGVILTNLLTRTLYQEQSRKE